MATLVLGAVGSSIAGPFGGFAGAVIGSIIDQQVIFPLLFPQTPLTGPRIDDRQLQVASEGSDMKWVIGALNRVGATLIWRSELIREKESTTIGKGGGGQAVRGERYFLHMAIAATQTENLPGGKINRILKIWGNEKVYYDGQVAPRFDAIRFYLGDQTEPDPLMEEARGVGNAPAFISLAYVMMEKCALEDSGNGIPNWTLLIEQAPDVDVAEALGLVMGRWGYGEEDFDTTRVSGCFKGEIVSGVQRGVTVLEPLVIAYQLIIRETGGRVEIMTRGEEDIVVVDEGDLGCHEFGTEPGDLVNIVKPDDINLPSEVNVSFVSTDNDFQRGSEREDLTEVEHVNAQSIDLPLTLSPTEARAIARVSAWSAQPSSVKYSGRLPPSYVGLQAGDVIRASIRGTDHTIFVTQVTIGHNFLVEFAGVGHDPDTWVQSGVAQGSPVVPGQVGDLPETEFLVVDAPAATNDLTSQIGVYFVVANDQPTAPWRGAALYSSEEVLTGYVRRADAPDEATLGIVLEPPGPAQPWMWDTGNQLTVRLTNGTLESCSALECLRGTNRAVIRHPSGDWEVIGFQTVASVGTRTYRLTNLLRGLRGTEAFISGHTQGAAFALLDTAVGFWASGPQVLGAQTYFRAPAIGGLVSDSPYVRETVRGVTMRPFAPTHLRLEQGPRARGNFVSEESVFSASGNTFSGTTGSFNRFRDAYWVTTSGWASNNGPHRIVSVSQAGDTMEVETSLASESPSGNVNFVEGHPLDLTIAWRRRSKQLLSMFAPGPPSPDELPLRFDVAVRRGGLLAPIVRSWSTPGETVVYTREQQLEDDQPTQFRLLVTVQQFSQSVGLGVKAQGEVIVS